MKQRVITGGLLAVAMIALFLLSHTFVYPVFVTILCVVATWEILGCVGGRTNLFIALPALASALVSSILAYFLGYGACLTVIMLYLTVSLVLCVFFDEKVKFPQMSESFVTTLYVILCFAALLRLRYIEDVGQYVYLLVFVAAWITDTFAYFTGFFFGKHKLIPKISPKKTVEGAIGGIIFCVIAFAVYGFVLEGAFDVDVNILTLLTVGIVMSVISQIGDLVASVIKRTYGIKDYGKIFPGHGGVLDRFDSIMILSPFLLFAVENLNLFN